MINDKELEYHLKEFEKNENHIEYFTSIFLEGIKSNPIKGRAVLDNVSKIAKKNNYEVAYGWCLLYKGWDYHISCDYNEACKCRQEADEIFIRNNEIRGRLLVYSALLADYSRLGNLDLAIETGLLGIELAEKVNNEEVLIYLMLNTSIAYTECRKYDEAKYILNKIKQIYKKIDNGALICYYITLAEIEVNCENAEESYEICKKAYEIIKTEGYWIYECEVLSIRAEANSKLGKHKDAEDDFKAAIINAREFNNTIFVAKTLKRWAKYYDRINKLDSVEEKLIQALEEISKINSSLDKSEIYYELSEFYAKTNKINEAYKFLKKHLELEKEIFNSKSSSWFARIHSKEITREAKIYKELYQEIDLISDIGKKLTSDLKIEKNLNIIYEEVRELMEADIFGIALYKESEKSLNYDLFIVDGKLSDYGMVHLDQESFGVWCYKNQENVVINDIENEYKKYVSSRVNKLDNGNTKRVKSLVFCPIIIENKAIGILSVQSYKKNAYHRNDIKKLEILTSYMAIALENAKLFNNIEYSATHDGLTDILNRKEILRKGEKVLTNKETCSVLIIDIDYFKAINDSYGHTAGDYVLKSISDIMKKNIDNNGYIGRYGGEEFLVVIYNCNEDKVMKIAEDLREKVEKYNFIINSEEINVTVSIGIYNYNKNDEKFYNSIKFADEALYMAKSLGRNKVESYNRMMCLI